MADLLFHPGRAPAWVDLRPFASDVWRMPWGGDEYAFSPDFGHGL